tara:strand:- start:260 stop:694 length:435 start_codon:yes stop_codon:yes gene_type:complete
MLPIVGLAFTTEIIGKEIIGETSKGIFGLLLGINEFNIPYINLLLEDLDILKIIELVESLFREKTSFESMIFLSPAQILAYNNLHDINLKIKNELEIITTKIEESKNWWFKYFRTAPYHYNLENLKRYKKILDRRFDIVLKLNT